MSENIQEVNQDEANYCVVFSRNSICQKEVIKKFYYKLPMSIYCAGMVNDILIKNPQLASAGIRMDIYSVADGKVYLHD